MHTPKQVYRAILIMATAVIATCFVAIPEALAADPAAPAANQVGTGGPRDTGPVQLTPDEQALAAQKDHLAQDYALVREGTMDRATFNRENAAFLATHGGLGATQATAPAGSTAALAASNTLAMSQYAQGNTYYCGPASAYEALKFKGGGPGPLGEPLSQTNLGKQVNQYPTSYLQTNQYQSTDWSRGVMAPTLTAWLHATFYVAHNGSGSFQTNLVYDVDTGWPVVIGVMEPQYGVHLVGHPANLYIVHWIAAHGYSSSGANTYYADSVALTTFWTWSANVPRYSYLPTTTMNALMNPFGYVY